MPVDRECGFCGKIFKVRWASDATKTCSQSCGGKLSARIRGNAPWLDEEIDFLRARIGARTANQIYRGLANNARLYGWPQRSRESVAGKLSRLCKREGFGSYKVDTDYWSSLGLATLLKVSPERILRWRSLGLTARKLPNGRYEIHRKNIIPWAKANPEEFAGIDRDALLFIFDDPGLADDVFDASPNHRRGIPEPVVCVETGQVYPSRVEAAKVFFVSPATISQSIKSGYRAANYHWRKAV